MPAKRSATDSTKDSTAAIGFEAKLWLAADKLRNNMAAAEYKHVVLGLIFLKYIPATLEEHLQPVRQRRHHQSLTGLAHFLLGSAG